MKIGFTGTRQGMTASQSWTFLWFLRRLVRIGDHFHHGDCVGADQQAHEMARSLGLWIVLHPPEKAVLRAFCQGHQERPSQEYHARNRDIVSEASDWLIACPAGRSEQGGTWYTIKHARQVGRSHVVIWPDGKMDFWLASEGNFVLKMESLAIHQEGT